MNGPNRLFVQKVDMLQQPLVVPARRRPLSVKVSVTRVGKPFFLHVIGANGLTESIVVTTELHLEFLEIE